MGEIYILNRQNYKNTLQVNHCIVFREYLTEKEADDFLNLQKIISEEISEEINLLSKKSLKNVNPYRAKGLFFTLALKDERCIAYGYGNIDFENENIFYINTIAVHPDFRNRKVATEIKVKMIEKIFEMEQVEAIKAITQQNNLATIHINKKLGFKKVS